MRERIEFLNEASVMKEFNCHHVVRESPWEVRTLQMQSPWCVRGLSVSLRTASVVTLLLTVTWAPWSVETLVLSTYYQPAGSSTT
jgi:hypothetical protein